MVSPQVKLAQEQAPRSVELNDEGLNAELPPVRGRVNGVHYTTSKAALIGLTRALCKELGPRRIRVNTVAPGLTETEPGAGLPPAAVERIVGMTALGRICQPSDVANAVLFLAGDPSSYISGVTLNVDGGV